MKNVTSNTLTLNAKTKTKPTESYKISLISGGIYELEQTWTYHDLSDLVSQGKLIIYGEDDVADSTEPEPTLDPVTETVADSTDEEIVEEDEPTEEHEEDTETKSDSFICEICGAEYASLRGLQSHLSRSHKQ